MWMMLQQGCPDDYVICTGETYTVKQFLETAFERVDIHDWYKYVVIDSEFYRPAEVDYLRGNNEKAKNKLGWTPKHSFKSLVALMMDHDLHENL
jgi:GDPmannose 4,6-dehydratase